MHVVHVKENPENRTRRDKERAGQRGSPGFKLSAC